MLIGLKENTYAFSNGYPITRNGSHYNPNWKEVFIFLPQVLKHAHNSNKEIEKTLVNHIAHEVLHKTLHQIIDYKTCVKLDNICSRKQKVVNLKYWYAGIFDKKERK